MRVFGDEKMPAKTLDPIFGRTEEVHLFLVLLPLVPLLLVGKMPAVLGRPSLVKNGRIITAMEINIGLDEEMIGEEAASVTQQDFQHAVLAPLAPTHGSWLEVGRQGQADRHQQ